MPDGAVADVAGVDVAGVDVAGVDVAGGDVAERQTTATTQQPTVTPAAAGIP